MFDFIDPPPAKVDIRLIDPPAVVVRAAVAPKPSPPSQVVFRPWPVFRPVPVWCPPGRP